MQITACKTGAPRYYNALLYSRLNVKYLFVKPANFLIRWHRGMLTLCLQESLRNVH